MASEMSPANTMKAAKSSVPDASLGGHLYIQTNEIKNAIIHYRLGPDGGLNHAEYFYTNGAGSGTFKPISGQESAPNAFEGANSVILSPDNKWLFATNGGDNTVSSFSVGDDGGLTLVDCVPSGNAVDGRSGTAKALSFAASSGTLYVLHSFGPDHLRVMKVSGDGKLALTDAKHTMNTPEKTDRVPTEAIISPDGRFLVVGTTFDRPIAHVGLYPNGAPILWAPNEAGSYTLIASNVPDPDGIVVFPIQGDGSLGEGMFQDAKGGSPFAITFLNHQPDTFVIGYAVGDGCALAKIDANGRIDVQPVAKIDVSAGSPAELCWVVVSPDDKFVYAANFGYGWISSFRLEDGKLAIAKDVACPKVPGDGTALGLNGIVTSGPADNWITPDGGFLYQIYGNAGKLVGYATERDGTLTKVTEAKIPYNSPIGMAGF